MTGCLTGGTALVLTRNRRLSGSMGKSLLLRVPLTLALLIGGCHRQHARVDEVSVIVPKDTGGALGEDGRALQLVRLDREGQVVPDTAARWAILDDGRDYIIRIDDAAGLSAVRIARSLRQTLRRHAHDPDFAALAAISSVEAVTNTVVELRLSSPQPDLLVLLARPELALAERAARPVGRAAVSHVHADPVGRAVARFAAGDAALVLGGTFTDLPVAHAAQLPSRTLRFDPATGLFGFAIRNGQLAPAVRNALSLAIDRDRIARLVGAPRQVKATTIAGSQPEPPLAERQAAARALLSSGNAHVRVAMPAGPGARLLFALAARDWANVGIVAEAVPIGDRNADLLLVDRVAPAGTLATLACALGAGCDPHDRVALINPPFIPIMTPVRWSLVAPELDLFTENALAAHPLDQLRSRR